MLDLNDAALIALALVACEPEQPARTPVNAPTAPAPGTLRLPVDGEWRVFRTHYGNKRDQSSAVDLVLNAPYPQGRRPLAEFPTYGQPVVADGPGVVVLLVDGVPDNALGTTNFYDAHGNHLVIDHQDGTFSLFAHLKPGGMRVRIGERVSAGQPIGACGNSGRSSMPHLHWQVMDHPHAHVARGVPIPISPYKRNGGHSRERLERGDVIRALEAPSR